MKKITDILSKSEVITLTAKVCHFIAFWEFDPTLQLPKSVRITRPNISGYGTPVMDYKGEEVEFDWVRIEGYPIIMDGRIVAYAPSIQIAKSVLESNAFVESFSTHTHIVKSQYAAEINKAFNSIGYVEQIS